MRTAGRPTLFGRRGDTLVLNEPARSGDAATLRKRNVNYEDFLRLETGLCRAALPE